MPETEARLRQNFTWDAIGGLGTGLFNALVVNFLAVIARREGADPLLLAALAAGPFAANTLAIKVDDPHRLRYQAAHTSITGLRGVAAPFVGSLALSAGLGVGPVLVAGGVLGTIGAVLMASGLGVEVPGLRFVQVRTVLGDASRPGRNVRARHRILGLHARVEKSPFADVHQVLLARQQRPATQPIGGFGSAERTLQAPKQLVHDPAWYPLSLAGVDVAEENQVCHQHAPLTAEATQ
jgi:hypothetical protein